MKNKKTPKINFLSKQQGILKLQARRFSIIKTLSVALLAVYGLFLFAVFSYTIYLKVSLKTVKQRLEIEKTLIEDLGETRFKYYLLKNKVNSFSNIYGSLSKHQEMIGKLFNIIPEGVFLSGVKIDDQGQALFVAKSFQMPKIEKLIDNIKKEKDKGSILIVESNVEDVSVNQTGEYALKFNILFKNK